jgi:hypothetical protein
MISKFCRIYKACFLLIARLKDSVAFLPALRYYGKKGGNPIATSRLNVSDYSENLA